MIRTVQILGKDYHTIRLPKGTVLFRGLTIEATPEGYVSLFSDLLGHPVGSDKRGIAPTTNTFFYPVPYASNVVNMFPIHAMYITQYDLDLFLLITPSPISRGNIRHRAIYKDVLTQCDKISKKDKCGFTMSDTDPCIAEHVRQHLPNIIGYIAIAESDTRAIQRQYKDFVEKYHDIGKALHILPGIASNSANHVGIPELVIYPLHRRIEDCVLMPYSSFIGSPGLIHRVCTQRRAEFNFFPFLYFTPHGVFTWDEMASNATYEAIKLSIMANTYHTAMPMIYTSIDTVFSEMLNKGYMVNGHNYKVYIDKKTGFYQIRYKTYANARRRTSKRSIINPSFKDTPNFISEYIAGPINDTDINNSISAHLNYIEDLVRMLHKKGYGLYRKQLIDPNQDISIAHQYVIDRVLERPDIHTANSNYQKRNKTKKNINRNTAYLQYGLDGIINDVSSVESNASSWINSTLPPI